MRLQGEVVDQVDLVGVWEDLVVQVDMVDILLILVSGVILELLVGMENILLLEDILTHGEVVDMGTIQPIAAWDTVTEVLTVVEDETVPMIAIGIETEIEIVTHTAVEGIVMATVAVGMIVEEGMMIVKNADTAETGKIVTAAVTDIKHSLLTTSYLSNRI